MVVAETNPKNLASALKRDPALLEWVNRHYGVSLSERVYNALRPLEHTCERGQKKRFNSVTAGYRFCGKASECQCARESVAAKVSAAKNSLTSEQKTRINEKRSATNLEKYGVVNTGQTQTAKENHKAVYADHEKVAEISARVAQTKIANHGTASYNNPDKIRQTFKQKRTDGYWVNRYPDKDIACLESKDELTRLFESMTVVEIAETLGVHIQTVYRYLNQHNIREPFKSVDEKEVEQFLLSLGITNIVRNSRKILPSRRELDFFLPDYDIAIEYNGVYWHHEDVAHITRDYHWKKFKECEELGIQLITIFSNFWHLKKAIVKTTLTNKLLRSTNKIYGRRCSVKLISSKAAKDFLNQYHIQGYTPAQIVYGLYHNDSLTAVMSFSKTRTAIGNSSDDYELVRFASSTRVVGGASKLLAQFRKDYPDASIISYSDNEWSTGNLYRQLEFTLEKEIPASYWYLKPNEHRLYHRYTFNKQKLIKLGYSSSLTEAQITREMGLLKVWDCGKKKWALRP
ncbi:MAG: hypothetical protein WC966_12150 [Bradymonadales bacterium]